MEINTQKGTWKLLEDSFATHKTSAMLNILPPLWQLEPLYAQTCHKAGLPALSCSPKNMPLGREMIRQIAADAILIHAELVPAFKLLLDEINISPSLWYVLSEQGEVPDVLKDETVVTEKYVIPNYLS